jgi:hypothetical protein
MVTIAIALYIDPHCRTPVVLGTTMADHGLAASGIRSRHAARVPTDPNDVLFTKDLQSHPLTQVGFFCLVLVRRRPADGAPHACLLPRMTSAERAFQATLTCRIARRSHRG